MNAQDKSSPTGRGSGPLSADDATPAGGAGDGSLVYEVGELRLVKPEPVAPPEPETESKVAAASTSSSGRRLLLLDDDAQLCEVLGSLLQWHGYEVTAVHRGVDGVLEIMKADFDVIVCDIVMPTMRGDVFYVAVERVKPHLCRRFVFITGNGDDAQLMFRLKGYGQPVLMKPLDTHALLAQVEKTIMPASGAEQPTSAG